MADPRKEKCIEMLPQIRVGPTLLRDLKTISKGDMRSVSDYVRMVLMLHLYGHGTTIGEIEEEDE